MLSLRLDSPAIEDAYCEHGVKFNYEPQNLQHANQGQICFLQQHTSTLQTNRRRRRTRFTLATATFL